MILCNIPILFFQFFSFNDISITCTFSELFICSICSRSQVFNFLIFLIHMEMCLVLGRRHICIARKQMILLVKNEKYSYPHLIIGHFGRNA